MSIHNRATISIIGLYNWDPSIFDDMALPNSVDRDEIIQDILYTAGDLEIVYPDWGVMKNAIKIWSSEELFKWEKIERLALADYNPIENYDRIETETINDSRQRTGNDISNTDLTNKTATTSGETTDSTDTHGVTGYNTVKPVTESEDTTKSKTENSGVTTGKAKSTDVKQRMEKELGDTVRSLRAHGNIGTMTPAEMMAKELAIYPELNLCKIIPEDFKLRFCMMVY